jgi:hypothetical protein
MQRGLPRPITYREFTHANEALGCQARRASQVFGIAASSSSLVAGLQKAAQPDAG